MDLALKNPAIITRGRSPEIDGGQAMADTKTVIDVLGTGTVTAAVTYFLTRGDGRRRELEESHRQELLQAEHRVAEAMAGRESDRLRLQHLEGRMDMKDREMEEVRSDKLKLEALVFTLEHQIADLNLQITTYQQNEIAFHTTIAELQQRLTAKTTELFTAQERLQAIKTAHARGEITNAVLYQGQKHVEVAEIDTD